MLLLKAWVGSTTTCLFSRRGGIGRGGERSVVDGVGWGGVRELLHCCCCCCWIRPTIVLNITRTRTGVGCLCRLCLATRPGCSSTSHPTPAAACRHVSVCVIVLFFPYTYMLCASCSVRGQVEMLLKHGAYDVFKDGQEAAKKFCEDDIESILSRAKVERVIHLVSLCSCNFL